MYILNFRVDIYLSALFFYAVKKYFIIIICCQSLNSNLSKISAAIVATRVTDLNNPPNTFILNTAVEPVGLPSYLGCNGCVVIQQNPGDNRYSAQLAFSFGSDKIAIRRRYGGEEWTNWKYFTAS